MKRVFVILALVTLAGCGSMKSSGSSSGSMDSGVGSLPDPSNTLANTPELMWHLP